MKYLYWIMTSIFIFLLLTFVMSFSLSEGNVAFYAPFSELPAEEVSFFSVPYLDEEASSFMNAFQNATASEGVTLGYRTFNNSYFGADDQGILLLTTTDKKALSSFSVKNSEAVSSLEAGNLLSSNTGEIQGVSKEHPFYLGSLSLLESDIPSGYFYLLETSVDKTNKIKSEVLETTGVMLEETDLYQATSGNSRFSRTLYHSLKDPSLLAFMALLITMVIFYLSLRKAGVLRKLFGYKILHQFQFLFLKLLLPSLVLGGILIIVLPLVKGFYPSWILRDILPQGGLILLLVFLIQALLLCFFLMDIRGQWVSDTLKNKRNNKVISVLMVGLKICLLTLCIPLLFYSFDRTPELTEYYRLMKDVEDGYEDVFYVDAKGSPQNLGELTDKGHPLTYGEGEGPSWLKSFYDNLSNEEPIFISQLTSLPMENEDVLALQVDSNYLDIHQLIDEKGEKIDTSHLEPVIITSPDLYEKVNNQLPTLQRNTMQFNLAPGEPQTLLMPEDYQEIQLIKASKDTKVRYYQTHNPEFIDEVSSFVLLVNLYYPVYNIEDYKFKLSEEELDSVLSGVKDMPLVEYLKIHPFSESLLESQSNLRDELKSNVMRMISVLATTLFLSYFLYRFLFDWFKKNFSVKYLFGNPLLKVSGVFLIVLVALDFCALTFWMIKGPPLFRSSAVYGAIVLIGVDLIFYFINLILFKGKILGNLRKRA